MKKKSITTVEDKIADRIAVSDCDVFLRKDFQDIANYDQVGYGLKQLVKKSKIVKIGYGLYAKAAIFPLSKRTVPCKALRELATEALKKFKVEVFPSSYDQTYNEGRTTQVPTGRVIGVKKRISRRIGYEGKYVRHEYI